MTCDMRVTCRPMCTYFNYILEGVDVVSFGLDELTHDEQQCSGGESGGNLNI